MHAIPTTYAGVNFRSRLEARWAAFFDLLGWSWEYEPIDLAGYIPDFILDGRVLVEVRPVLWTGSTQEAAALQHLSRRFNRSGWEGPLGVFGARFVPDPEDFVVGYCRKRHARTWSKAWIDHKYHLEFAGETVRSEASFTDNGTIDLNVILAWNEAGNHAQWKPAK